MEDAPAKTEYLLPPPLDEADVLNNSADVFANSSAETVTENTSFTDFPPPPPEFANPLSPENSSFLVNQFIASSHNGSSSERIYCPFCFSDFAFEFLVKDHIKEHHPQEVKTVLRAKTEVDFYPCPFCHAKFYLRELLPKHILRKHEVEVLDMFSGENNESFSCGFCSHKVLKKHHKLLSVHLEKKHFKQFEKYIFGKFSKIAMSCEDLVSFDSDGKVATQIITSPSNDDKVIYARRNVVIKPILKRRPSENTEDSTDELDETPRRKLRFNLPDSPEGESLRNINMKLKHAFGKKKKTSKLQNFFKGTSHEVIPIKGSPIRTPTKSPLKLSNSNVLYFKCGLCSQAFEHNAQLVEHLRGSHKGLIIMPQYQCGDCKAKFFRNSFLVRHCWFHHKPLCLQGKFSQKDL